LIAGRIADEFNKPTAVFQKQGLEYVGSFRSINQVNIVEVLEQCSDLLIKFGGHSQAAGAQVRAENMEALYEKMLQIIESELQGKDLSPVIEVDYELLPEETDTGLLDDILQLQPFGEGNAEPVFMMQKMSIEKFKTVGNGSKHLKLVLGDSKSQATFNAIGFGLGEEYPEIKEGDIIDIVFNLKEDEWNGGGAIQLFLIDLRKSDD
jgi:single-stranded-DNA-specific exonuclease